MQNITAIFTWTLIELYSVLGNLGVSLIVFTILIRSLLLPLTLPSQKAQHQLRKKLKEIQPEIKALKKKHGSNNQAFQMAQLELYKKYNVNPLAGCIPQLVQLGVLFILYNFLMKFLGQDSINGVEINTMFGWFDLSKPDKTYVLPVLTALSQLALSLMLAPATEVKDEVPNDSKNKKVQASNDKEEDMAEMQAMIQQQSIYILPFAIGFSALSFPSGLALYWLVTTIFSIAQQWVVSGPGGLVTYPQRWWSKITKRNKNT
jgi:YidC/Oxa1 family membrane protein insertase